MCCSTGQNTSQTGIAVISTANANLDGSGSMAILIAGRDNGLSVNSITIKAITDTTQGMIRIFLSKDNGSTKQLFKEIAIPATTKSDVVPALQMTLYLDLVVADGIEVYVSTEVAETFIIIADATTWLYPA